LAGLVAAALAVEINRGIAGVIGGPFATAILAFEALVDGPRLNQSAVHREVLSGEQITATGSSQHLGKERICYLGPQQPFAVRK
jgi:hypothetical protein